MKRKTEVMTQVEKWDVFEIALDGKTEGNPFTDYEIKGEFEGNNEKKCVTGFYDGDGVYKVRFMPSFEGTYTYKIYGTYSDEAEYTGEFTVTPASEGNHGPVRILQANVQ